jgi:DNA adenine methylase
MPGILPYIGGKNRLANRIIELLPPHHTYVEVFGGGASVLLRKLPSKVEILNDLDGEVTNVFRVAQLHEEELIRYMRYMLSGRDWFDLLKRTDPGTLTDVQRAARSIFLQKNAYAGMVVRRSYNPGVLQPSGFNVERLPEIIRKTHERLARVQIENLPYEQILKRYDREATVFFADPPYYARKLYRFNFEHEDFAVLAKLLAALKGKFLLSLNDVPEVRKLFREFRFREVDLHYTAQKKAGKRFRELLITNY